MLIAALIECQNISSDITISKIINMQHYIITISKLTQSWKNNPNQNCPFLSRNPTGCCPATKNQFNGRFFFGDAPLPVNTRLRLAGRKGLEGACKGSRELKGWWISGGNETFPENQQHGFPPTCRQIREYVALKKMDMDMGTWDFFHQKKEEIIWTKPLI